ncbi:hypothetical protein RRG08_005838 [Elysia crispata]|uniref:Uncharacterized protein n=1 Tax=Elysia crispata TaxID=231223 RepID=A0AAE1CTT1_9GAST|nr:hypothetical protein RRG08_005838 [Elysia crispata]
MVQLSDDLKIFGQMNLEEYMGLMKYLWPFVAYSKDHPEVDLAADIRKDMASALAKVNPPGNTTFDISWDMFILMGHKPSK